jgi:hypothetical protein
VIDSSSSQGKMFGVERLDEAVCRFEGDHMKGLNTLSADAAIPWTINHLFGDCTAIVIDLHEVFIQGEC